MARAKRSEIDDAVVEVSISAELETVYRRHGSRLFRMLQRRFGREAAEEVSQEAYVRAAASTARVRDPRTFLIRIALNAATDRARRQAVRPRATADLDDLAIPNLAADQAELLLLKEVVLSLPRNLRDVFLLSRIGGMTYEEVAEHLGVSVHTVKVRMAKALRICADRVRN